METFNFEQFTPYTRTARPIFSQRRKPVVIRGAKHTTKENLIDFMSSDDFDKIFRKSDWHLKQIKRLRSIVNTKDLV